MKTAKFLLLIGVLFASGCSQRLGDFTVLSTKNVDLSNFSTLQEKNTDRVRGEDVAHIVFIYSNKVPTFKEAIDIALDENSSYMLSDAVLKYEWFYIPLIYGQEKFVAEGIPVKKN
jgi:hypothetical protein